jgi:hypothetical protein
MTKESVTEQLTRDLKPFLAFGVEIEVDVDDEGVLRSFTLIDGPLYFVVHGDAFTWEKHS